jgi:hypothetical protein
MLALDILFLVTFCVAMIVAPIAWLRMLKAKNQSAYLKNIAWFVVSILVVFALGGLTGAFDQQTPSPPQRVQTGATEGLSWIQVVLLSLAGATWIGGGSLLWLSHTKRVGRPWWTVMNPLQPQFRDFTSKEWAVLGGLAVVALSLGAIAINLGPPQ